MEPLQDYLAVCEKAVRRGGLAIAQLAGKFDVREKGPADLVTEADVASQQAISQTIWNVFPDHCIIGEEDINTGSAANDRLRRSPYRWIIDPLDGTTNFVHGVPHYAVSLALERNNEPLVGAVLNPVNGECFTAALGQGARLNGRLIHTSKVTELSEALGVMGVPPGVRQDSPDLLVYSQAVFHCQAIHRTGSAALNLCYIAAGRYDLVWTFSTKIWDVAAGILLIREAGGAICTPDGRDYHLDQGPFLAAANPGS